MSPDFGYSGDEDQGLMGSLAVLMKTGIFSVNGGTSEDPFYEIGSPLFDKITIHLQPGYYNGNDVVIRADGNGTDNLYIQSAEWNGKQWQRPWIRHADLLSGGTLILKMGPNPNKNWGSKPEDAPPSMTPVGTAPQ